MSGTGRQRIDLGAMGSGGKSASSSKEPAKAAKASKPSKAPGGGLDSKAKIKAGIAVGVILVALGFILNYMGVFESSGGANAPLRDLTPEEQEEYNRLIQEQQPPPNMRVNQPPPAGSS